MADENPSQRQGKQPPKINLNGNAEARPPSSKPAEILTPAIQPPPKTKVLSRSPKSDTARIDLSLAQVPPIPVGVAPRSGDDIKKSTTRIDVAAGMAPISEEDKQEAAKKSTVRVQIDEEKAKGDTARLEPVALDGNEAKKRTARIDLNEVLEADDDIFKRRTALLDASKFTGTTEAAGVPRTIRIKRPDQPPTATVKPQPPTAEVRPPAPPEPEEEIIEEEEESDKKSATARIDLPPEATEQPPTRRKTIRIKRPGGGVSSKPLVISRTTESVTIPEDIPSKEEPEASPAFSWIAIAAVLLSLVLLYVLAAQTIANGLPFPGRL